MKMDMESGAFCGLKSNEFKERERAGGGIIERAILDLEMQNS